MPLDTTPVGNMARSARAAEIHSQFKQMPSMPREAPGKREHGFAMELAVEEARGCPADPSIEAAAMYLLSRNCALYEEHAGVRFEDVKIFHDNFNAPDPENPGKYKHRIAWYATSS